MFVFLLACAQPTEPETECVDCAPVTEGDADTDSDADADADTDTDTDTGPPEPVDSDLDGVPDDEDCAPADPAVYPGNVEQCDGVDNDCDATVDEDLTTTTWVDGDGDGYGAGDPIEACALTDGFAGTDGDCDDGAADVYPGATDADDDGDGVDDDCDGETDEDWDPCAEPYGSLEAVQDTLATNVDGPFWRGLEGYGYVCDVSCPDAWLVYEGVTLDWGATWEELPVFVDGELGIRLSVTDPGGAAESTCTFRTSGGDVEFFVQWF